MKIVMITPYYPPIIGGITNYVLYLTAHLNKINNEVVVITRMGHNNIDVLSINTNKIIFVFKSFIQLLKIKPDVIHSHGGWYTLFPGVLYKILFSNAKLIQTEHTEPSVNINYIIKLFLKTLYSQCNTVVYISESTRDIFEKDFELHSNYAKIHGGAFVEKFEKKDIDDNLKKYKLDLLINSPLIAFLGPLAWKLKVEGVKKLIVSFSLINKKLPNAVLLIIGDGQYRQELESLVSDLDLDKNVIFTGFIKPHPLLSICNIYAHISLMDNLPLSIVEAMYLGIPVVATKVGDIPELIKNNETGILVDSDVESITKAILKLWNDKEKMEKISENAKKLVKNEYGWDKIAKKYIDIYNW